MKLYLAGPMRGIKEFNFPAFIEAAEALRFRGHEVFNPAERDIDVGFEWRGLTGSPDELAERDFDLRAALGADLAWITEHADGVVVLPGWENSSGARAEVATAKALGLEVYEYTGAGIIQPMPAQVLAGAVFCASAARPPKNTQAVLDVLRSINTEEGVSMGAWRDAAEASGIPRSAFYRGVKSLADAALIRESGMPARSRYWPADATPTEIRVVNETTGGEKGSKPARYDLLPAEPLRQVAEHYGKGAAKYEDRNWERGYDWSLSFAALQRHAWQFWAGEDVDVETGSHHMAAVVFHAFALMQFGATRPELDDRATA